MVNSSSEDNSKSAYSKCGAGAWRMHQSYDPQEANHMRDAHALYNPRYVAKGVESGMWGDYERERERERRTKSHILDIYKAQTRNSRSF